MASGTSGQSVEQPAPALPTAVLMPPRTTLAELRGGPAAINFWASWCGPCRQEAPQLEKLARSLPGRARLVGVDYSDSLSGSRAFVRGYHLTYPILSDPDGVVGNRYGVAGLPVTAILNARGRIVELLRGPQTATGLRQALREAAG